MDCSAVSVEDILVAVEDILVAVEGILVEDILVAEDGHMETGAVAEAAHIGCSHID